MALRSRSLTAASSTFVREVCLGVYLCIRHAEKLILCQGKWLVIEAPLSHAYLGRPILSALVLDSLVLLPAARDRIGGVVNFQQLIGDEKGADDVSNCNPSFCRVFKSRCFAGD